jgi:hypothetical protein
MFEWQGHLVATATLALLLALFGCIGPSEGTPAQNLSNQIAQLDPTDPEVLADLLKVAGDIDAALSQGTTSERQKNRLTKDLGNKFNEWVKSRVDELDPSDDEFIGKFVNLTKFQQTNEYKKWCSDETHEYKEQKLKEKFDEWTRREVDKLDPSDDEFIGKFVNLTNFQQTDIYGEWRSDELHEYKEKKLKEKFDQFIKQEVDKLDPYHPDFLEKVNNLTMLQQTDIYVEWCSKETHQYKEAKLREKYNQWLKITTPQPEEPTYTTPAATLDVSWEASCSWSSKANMASLTINFNGRDLTNGKASVARVVVEVDGNIVHDSATIAVVNYSNSVTLQVSKGSHNIKTWAVNAKDQRAEASKTITCSQ